MSQSSGEPVTYGLYAVLVHSGYSCHAGHYYCYVKVSGAAARLPSWAQVCSGRWDKSGGPCSTSVLWTVALGCSGVGSCCASVRES